MKDFRILNSKQTREIYSMLEARYGFSAKLDFSFLKNKDDIYLISRDLAKVDVKKLNINSLGLYFGEVKNDSIRLSIDATNMIGSKLGKNILMLDEEQAMYWIKGDDLPLQTDMKGIVVVKHNQDYLGSGIIKNGILLNHVPKERRLKLKEMPLEDIKGGIGT